jgi:aryl-alcohol dehydrogenase-like predicted oxidoreductase
VVLATKVSRPMGDDPNQQGASRRWIMTAVEDSLRRLQTDYIDLYQIQRPDPDTDIEETLSALSDLIHAGKVRAIVWGPLGQGMLTGVSARDREPTSSAPAS